MPPRDNEILLALGLCLGFILFASGALHEHHNQELPRIAKLEEQLAFREQTNEILLEIVHQRGCALLWAEPRLQVVYFPDWEGWDLEPLACPPDPFYPPVQPEVPAGAGLYGAD